MASSFISVDRRLGAAGPTPDQFEHFRYSPLPNSTSIRLLSFVGQSERIRAVSWDNYPLLECHLSVVDLKDQPHYKAISYTWGSFEQKAPRQYDGYAATVKLPIILNGRVLYITRNLHDALFQFGPYAQQFGQPIQKDIDKQREPFEKTPLIQAAEEGNLSMVTCLLQQGARVDSQDHFGETALHYAAENGYLLVVEQLLKSGANTTTRDRSARTPLDCCIQRKRRQHLEVSALLQNHHTHSHSSDSSTQSSADANSLVNSYGQAQSSSSYGVHIEAHPKFWIDAVCIDQQNNNERASQVAKMDLIFSNAQSVLVWLGPDDSTTPTAWNSLFSPKSKLPTDSDTDKEDALNRLFNRRWFQRKWIIQEMALARELEMFCGRFRFDWESISRILISMDDEATRLRKPRVRSEARVLAIMRYGATSDLIEQPNSSSSAAQVVRKKYGLPVLLGLTRAFETSEPRDRIYALLGIADIPLEYHLVPDYTCSLSELHMKASRMYIEALGCNKLPHPNSSTLYYGAEPLEGLSFVQKIICIKCGKDNLHCRCDPMSSIRHLPSWAFNVWRQPPHRIFNVKFSISKGMTPKLYDSAVEILKLDAHLIDHIAEVEQKSTNAGSPTPYGNPYSWFQMIANLNFTTTIGRGHTEMLWRTLIANNVEDENFTRSTFKVFLCEEFMKRKSGLLAKRSQTKLVRELAEMDRMDGFNCIPSPDEVERFRKDGGVNSYSYNVGSRNERGFHHKYAKFGLGRSLIRTRCGYLALGPDWSRPGDEMWLLAGTRVPYVLRPLSNASPGQYSLVGEAYVHGIMHGELFDQREVDFQPIEIH